MVGIGIDVKKLLKYRFFDLLSPFLGAIDAMAEVRGRFPVSMRDWTTYFCKCPSVQVLICCRQSMAGLGGSNSSSKSYVAGWTHQKGLEFLNLWASRYLAVPEQAKGMRSRAMQLV